MSNVHWIHVGYYIVYILIISTYKRVRHSSTSNTLERHSENNFPFTCKFILSLIAYAWENCNKIITSKMDMASLSLHTWCYFILCTLFALYPSLSIISPSCPVSTYRNLPVTWRTESREYTYNISLYVSTIAMNLSPSLPHSLFLCLCLSFWCDVTYSERHSAACIWYLFSLGKCT